MRFQVGDLVTGTEENRYGLTNKNAIMKVIEVNNEEPYFGYQQMTVQILKVRKKELEKGYENVIGTNFFVEENQFLRFNKTKKIKL
jgi:hypothetical protein